MAHDAIWTPNGPVHLGSSKPSERVEVPTSIMRWFRQGADILTPMRLGLHCSKCNADIVANNSDTDTAWAFSCACRDFVGMNPSPKPPNMYDR